MKMHVTVMLLLLSVQWQKGFGQQLLSNPILVIDNTPDLIFRNYQIHVYIPSKCGLASVPATMRSIFAGTGG